MKTKNTIACLLAGTMAVGSFLAVSANNEAKDVDIDAPVLIAPKIMPESVSYSAKVKELFLEDEKVSAILCTTDSESLSEIQFNIGDETVVIDNNTKSAMSLSEIKVGDEIFVYASPITTMSIPAQSPALVVLANVGENAPAKFITVADVTENEGSFKITDTENNYICTITEDTQILPYRTRNIVTAHDIRKGGKILFWSEIMTASIPAYTGADAVVILPVEEDVKLPEDPSLGYEVAYTKDNGMDMIPVRKTFEELGYEIMWDDSLRRIDLVKGAQTFTINIGSKDYGISKMRVVLEDVAEIIDGRTYAPRSFFEAIFNN